MDRYVELPVSPPRRQPRHRNLYDPASQQVGTSDITFGPDETFTGTIFDAYVEASYPLSARVLVGPEATRQPSG